MPGLLLGADLAEAAHQDHRQLRADCQYLLRQFDPGHIRHGVIGDQQVELSRIGAEGRQCGSAAGFGGHLVAQLAEDLLPHFDQRDLVIHQQDAFCAPGQFAEGRQCRRCILTTPAGDARQVDVEAASPPGLTLDRDCPAVPLDDSMYH